MSRVRSPIRSLLLLLVLAIAAGRPRCGSATELHVAVSGKDANPGTKAAPLRTIQHAAELAQPGDVVTVHEGVYREQVKPPRGGSSNRQADRLPGRARRTGGDSRLRACQRLAKNLRRYLEAERAEQALRRLQPLC